MPPSTLMIAPVVKPDAADAERTASGATLARVADSAALSQTGSPGSEWRFADHGDVGGAAVGHPRLTPRLDRERRLAEGERQQQEVADIVGQVVEVEPVAVLDDVGHARQD